MSKTAALRHSLFLATSLTGLSAAQPVMAQTAAQIQTIEQQIKALQSQLGQVKAELAARDRALKAAQQQASQQQAKAAQEHQAAVQDHQAALQDHQAALPATQAAVSNEPPLPQGAFRVGGLTVTLGGFAAAEGIYRSRNEASSVATSFNGIPFPNSANYHTPEYRETAQQSRFSLLMEGPIDEAQKLTGYLENDFLSAGSSSNSNESNSYTLRLRQFWLNYDNTDLGLHFLGGQGWSLATMYKTGLVPRQENVPLTIDAQYVVGFDWARQAEFRVVKDFDNHKIWAGLSLEEPQTTFNGSAGPNCLTGAAATTATGGGTLEYTQCGGSNVNSIQAYSDNLAPDVIAKIAADPGWGHYEIMDCCDSWAAACPSLPLATARTIRLRAKALVAA